MFPCECCGICCRSIAGVAFAKDMVLPNGVCKFLDEEKNICRIYSTRPIFCNVDAYYDKYLSQTMSRQEFYAKNKEVCRQMQNKSKGSSDSNKYNRIISFESIPDSVRAKL